jgi:hypothetical protein
VIEELKPKVEETAKGVPVLAQWLGYAGLAPFVAGALELWLLPGVLVDFIERALLTYAAVILSFMGAVHWGLAMRSHRDVINLQLGLSVIPALLAWVALMLPAVAAYPVFILCFIALYVFDLQAVKAHMVPGWYPTLRLPLTIGVVLSLAVAYAYALMR